MKGIVYKKSEKGREKGRGEFEKGLKEGEREWRAKEEGDGGGGERRGVTASLARLGSHLDYTRLLYTSDASDE